MTGNASDAATALYGLSPLFEGSNRYIYLINGVVYKVCKHADEDETQNLLEWANMTRYSNSLPAPFRVPNAHIWPVNNRLILALDFIQGIDVGVCGACWSGGRLECDDPHLCLTEKTLYPLKDIWTDTSWGNAIKNSEGIWIIDFTY